MIGKNKKQMLRFVFIFIFGLCFAVVSYSVIRTVTADGNSRPMMAGISFGILAVLVAFELITAREAKNGIPVSLYSLIPGIVTWSTKSGLRKIIEIVFSFIKSEITSFSIIAPL